MIERMTTDTIIEIVNKYARRKKYLEIGVYRGGLISEIQSSFSLGIDNFSLFNENGDNKDATLQKIKGKHIKLIDGDCYSDSTKVKVNIYAPFDVFMYDGDHGTKPTADAIKQYHDFMKHEYILIVDDWNVPEVRNGTDMGLEGIKNELLEEHFTPKNASEDYWNGIAVFKVRK